MSRTRSFPAKVAGREKLSIKGSFPTNGSSSPTSFAGEGIASVVRSGTGTFTITLSDKYPSYEFVDAALQMGTPDGSMAVPAAVNVASAKTIVIVTLNASNAAADIAAAASNRVNFEIVVNQSTQVAKG